MPHNFDYTRADGTEVTVAYRITGGQGDYFAHGCWNPSDPVEVWFGKVYGLPEGEELTAEEYEEIEVAIFAKPHDIGDDELF